MRDYVKGMLDAFPIKFKKGETAAMPAGQVKIYLVKSQAMTRNWKRTRLKLFHATTAQGLFLTKRARPDIHTGIAFLCTQVWDPNEEDWEKII